jgi:hypothetical protein
MYSRFLSRLVPPRDLRAVTISGYRSQEVRALSQRCDRRTRKRTFSSGSLPRTHVPIPFVSRYRRLSCRNFFNDTPKREYSSNFAQEIAPSISSWSARLPAPASLFMLPSGRGLLRSLESSASRFYCASHGHYSTLSSSHREQVKIQCRSNGHITIK